MSYKTLFCGTPEFAVKPLESLLGDDLYAVTHILTQPDSRSGRGKQIHPSAVKRYALSKKLEAFAPLKARDPDFIKTIKSLNFDMAVVVAYGQILSQEFLDLFPKGCFNIHGSLLPRWRGAAPIQRAVMNGDSKTGVCIQKMVFQLDAGDVVGAREIELGDTLGSQELYTILSDLGAQLLTSELPEYLAGERYAQPQQESLVTHAAKIEKKESLVDWSQDARHIHNKVRGLNMGPFATATFRGKRVKFHQTQISSETSPCGEHMPGSIVQISKDSLAVKTGEGLLQILKLQPESKSQMSAGDFVRGFQVTEGECFESIL